MGQRGGGGTTAPRPVEVPRVAAARAVAAGLAHTCALLEGGTVRCWGANEAGQLGTGLTAIAGTTETVRDVAGAVAIGAGGRQSCAILADGSQRCWGADGPPRAEHVIFAMRTPVALQTPGIAGARAVAPGLAHNCILLQAGTVRCRGNNAEGQLGDGTFRHSRPPVEVRGLASARALASGGAHACVILGDGGVHCWGSNARGQLGRPVAETSPRPLAIAGVAGAVAVAAGAAHACAVLGDTTVRCWGRNADGQLGRGFMGPSSLRAEAVVGLSQVRALAAGAAFTCALLADGTVRCWGQNAQGQLGDGTTRSATVPLAVQGVAGALALGAGASQACAVVAGGRAVCWGHLAHEASAPATEAVGLVGVPTLTGASAVAVGQNFGCATRDDLTLVCWGANDRGQLATPEVTGAGHPVMVTGVAYPVAVAAGALHACALRRDGKVKCWGRSHLGQLGPSGVGESSPVPVGVDGLVGVAALSAGGAHSCALLADGGVRCWGANESAQLGQDASLRFSHRAVPVDVSR
jgi:alpha-tubulin suppressor-like RCC1 family protein